MRHIPDTEMEQLVRAIERTWQSIAADCPTSDREEVIEMTCDADRLHFHGYETEQALFREISMGMGYGKALTYVANFLHSERYEGGLGDTD